MLARTRSRLRAYIVAFFSTGASLLLQWPLQSVVGPSGVFWCSFLPSPRVAGEQRPRIIGHGGGGWL